MYITVRACVYLLSSLMNAYACALAPLKRFGASYRENRWFNQMIVVLLPLRTDHNCDHCMRVRVLLIYTEKVCRFNFFARFEQMSSGNRLASN